MIINTEQNQISKIFKKSEMGIKVDGLAHQMMIDGIYSNKVNSVFREISTNARDSHIQAGTDVPFEISIFHSTLNPSFCTVNIQDFGMGMSEEEVLTYLCNLNSSSKRNSNDVVGCFGIGSKSVFSLTDTYTYECVQDGVLTNLLLTKDKNGTPNFTHTTSETDRPNSVLCSFAMENSVMRILEALYEELSLFDIKPIIKIIKNNSDVFVKEPYSTTVRDNIIYHPEDFFPTVIEAEHFYIVDQTNKMSFLRNYFENKHIACGVIGYKLDNYSFSMYQGYNSLPQVVGILPKFELGSIKFGVSREIVENTPETDTLLSQKLIDIYNTYPKAKEISDFLKASSNFGTLRYGRDTINYSDERRELLENYSCPVLTSEQVIALGRDKVLFEYLLKDYFTNKFEIETSLDLCLVNYAFNRNNSLFKLFYKIPPETFNKVLVASPVKDLDIFSFYINSTIHNVDAYKVRYYTNQGGDLGLRRTLFSSFLYDKFSLKVTLFHYKTSENTIPKYVYSHKSLGSNTHLEGLLHQDVDIIKVSRTEDNHKVENVFKLAQNLFGIETTHLDSYKESHPDFFKTLRPTKKAVVRTEGEEAPLGISENGLRLRVKHDKIVHHLVQHDSALDMITTCYTDDTALTSSQCYNIFNTMSANYYPTLVFEDFILKDPKVMEKLARKCNVILLSEQSDPVEIRKILVLVKNNQRSGSVLFFDKILDEDFYSSFDDSFKISLVRSSLAYFHSELMATTTAILDPDVQNILTRSQYIFNNTELASTVSRAYSNRYDHDLFKYLIEHISEFEVDFLAITSVKDLIVKISTILYSDNREELLPELRGLLYDDNV